MMRFAAQPDTTSQRVALRQALNASSLADHAAAQRNHELVRDLQKSISTLRETQRKAAEVRAFKAQEEARQKQEAALAAVQAELAEVQQRRDQARADFEAELRARDEAARCRQQIVAEVELEKYDDIERETIRAGVAAQAAYAAAAKSVARDEAAMESKAAVPQPKRKSAPTAAARAS